MARKRKKKKAAAFGSMLKYEIYGIILITLSIIALSGEAAVGRSLSKMSALFLGKFYFVLPLIGIYVGLTVMISRKWPNRWTTRRTGILLAVLSFVLMSTISAMSHKLAPTVPMTFSNILGQVHRDLQQSLFSPTLTDGGFSLLNLNISGGYIGGIEFAVLFSLFGMAGAKLIMIVMMAISFMLITGLSYVDIFRILRTKFMEFGRLLGEKIRRLRPVPVSGNTRNNTKAKAVAVRNYAAAADDEDEEDEEEDDPPIPASSQKKTKKPVFFQLLGFKDRASDAVNDTTDMEFTGTNHPDGDSGGPNVQLQGRAAENETQQDINWNDLQYSGSASEETGPIIRDFFDNIQREGRLDEDEAEWSDEEQRYGVDSELNSATSSALTDADEAADHNISHLSPPAVEALAGESSAIVGEHSEDMAQSGAEAALPPKPAPKPYKLPSFRLLAKPINSGKSGDQADYMQTARKLEATLESFGVRARVLEVVRGPAVTRYEIQPDIGVKVSRIVNLTDDIALALAAKDIRMEAPIPGKSAIGIEVPNNEVSLVTMREVMETPAFVDAEAKLSIAFGRDISGQTIVGNLAKMPHLLVAGATGSGKSVCINGIITSILYKAKPDEVKFMMVDPKMVELNVYNGIPHLLTPVVTDPKRASLALKKIVVEMEKRYELFSKSGARNIEGYNLMMREKEHLAGVLPYIVVIVDELADLMMVAANDVEDAIARLAQMARAAGIHLIIATQRPSVDVITGVIKANIPSRIAFGVSSQVDSRTILDIGGAEKLLGRGDMLYMPMGASKPMRVQGAFMSDQEVETIVNFVRDQGQAEYDESLVPEIDDEVVEQDEVLDELYDQAVQIVLDAKHASVSLLQRRMRVGYTRAARLIDSMEARGIVGPYEGSKPREVLISIEQYKMGKASS